MATAYILWDRFEQRVVGNGAPLIFPSSLAATTHAASLRSGHDQQPKPTTTAKTYDAIAVTIA